MDAAQLQRELQTAIIEHQKLEIQFQENKLVKEEFDRLNSETKIYKLVGPVLLPQEKEDADTNVTKRLEFIEQQKQQAEEKIKNLREQMYKLQIELREQQIKQTVDSAKQPAK